MAPRKGFSPPNKIDRVGKTYGKLKVLSGSDDGRWLCACVCGNKSVVLSTNLANYQKNNRGCRHCCNRKNIAGVRKGLLVASNPESGVVIGRHPLWVFNCDCGGKIVGTVREFNANWIRSCGCHDNTFGSWSSMMARCYNKSNNRYSSYGGRGIKVVARWHEFEKFIEDMGERPKRHNIGRKHAEKPYGPSNCCWEHVSTNCRDTKNDGTPTKPGLKKGARSRKL